MSSDRKYNQSQFQQIFYWYDNSAKRRQSEWVPLNRKHLWTSSRNNFFNWIMYSSTSYLLFYIFIWTFFFSFKNIVNAFFLQQWPHFHLFPQFAIVFLLIKRVFLFERVHDIRVFVYPRYPWSTLPQIFEAWLNVNKSIVD